MLTIAVYSIAEKKQTKANKGKKRNDLLAALVSQLLIQDRIHFGGLNPWKACTSSTNKNFRFFFFFFFFLSFTQRQAIRNHWNGVSYWRGPSSLLSRHFLVSFFFFFWLAWTKKGNERRVRRKLLPLTRSIGKYRGSTTGASYMRLVSSYFTIYKVQCGQRPNPRSAVQQDPPNIDDQRLEVIHFTFYLVLEPDLLWDLSIEGAAYIISLSFSLSLFIDSFSCTLKPKVSSVRSAEIKDFQTTKLFIILDDISLFSYPSSLCPLTSATGSIYASERHCCRYYQLVCYSVAQLTKHPLFDRRRSFASALLRTI